MKFCRINLSKTNYNLLENAKIIFPSKDDIENLQNIYISYCRYKNFKSVMPLFDKEFTQNTIIGYYDTNELVAFSMIGIYDNKNIENYQFAWTYNKPEMYLGIKSLEHECAYFKSLGYEYLYLGDIDDYKTKFDGFEVLGPV